MQLPILCILSISNGQIELVLSRIWETKTVYLLAISPIKDRNNLNQVHITSWSVHDSRIFQENIIHKNVDETEKSGMIDRSQSLLTHLHPCSYANILSVLIHQRPIKAHRDIWA